MSISPQMRQLFMEILARELPYFRGAHGVIDKDALLASTLDSLEREHPMAAEAYRREAANTAGRVLLNEHLRFHQTTFVHGEVKRRARQFVQIPLENSNKFIPKMMTDLTKAEVRRMRRYHAGKAGSHEREAAWFDSVLTLMDAAGLPEESQVREVIGEAAPESIAV